MLTDAVSVKEMMTKRSMLSEVQLEVLCGTAVEIDEDIATMTNLTTRSAFQDLLEEYDEEDMQLQKFMN